MTLVKIYVDNDYKCHLLNGCTMTEVQTDFFDGKCNEFIEGYCYDDSKGFLAVYPWKPFEELDAAQRNYEQELAEAARILLGV